MPLIEDIQPFIATLNSLGHEPEVLAKKGESLEPVASSVDSLPDEVRQLVEQSGSPAPRIEESSGGEIPESDSGLALDFSQGEDESAGSEISPDFPDIPGLGDDIDFSSFSDMQTPFAEEEGGGTSATEEAARLPEDLPENDVPPEFALDDPSLESPPAEGPEGESSGTDELESFLKGFSPEEPADSLDSLDEKPLPAEAPEQETPEETPQQEEETIPDQAPKPGTPVAETPETAETDIFELPETSDEFTISDIEDEPSGGGKKSSDEDLLADFKIPGMDTPEFGEEIPEETSEETSEEMPPETGETGESFEIPDFPETEENEAPEGEKAETLNLDDLELPTFDTDVSGEQTEAEEQTGSEETGEETGSDIEELGSGDETEPSTETEDESFSLPGDTDFDNGIELPGEKGAASEELPGEEETPAGAGTGAHDEYSLGDFGTEFGIQESIPSATQATEINIPEGASNAIDAGASFTLSEKDFQRMQQTLQALPLNIKIVVEELIGDQKADEAAQMNLIRMLARGASIKNIAAVAGKLAGRTLVIPKGYAKSSGTTWEAEKGSFSYFLKETFWPVFKIAGTGVLAASLLIFLCYRFIYKPIHAHSLLERGLEMVEEDRFRDANALFTEGYREWAFKDYYFKYAGKFIEKKQYQLAQEKYEQLLDEYNDYLDSKGVRTERKKDEYFTQAAVEYAHFESTLLENYEGAERILNRLLSADMYNYAGLLEAGDNYIRWAEYDPERFSSKYEEARESYAIALGVYGNQDELLFRFLDLFIHTDNKPEVLRIKNYFEANPKKTVDPVRYAELGGYLLDKNEGISEARQILLRAMEVDKTIPGIHYHLARFYNKREEPVDERLALNNAIHLYSTTQPLSRTGLWRLIDSYGRSGELYARQRSFLEAETQFKQGIERYEDGIKKTLIKKDPVPGRLYQRLGDIYYYQSGDLEAAYQQFVKAEDSLVADPGLYYKKGFIDYTREDYAQALREFVRTEESFPSSRNLIFALGNANYMRNNFSIAEGYYSYLSQKLQTDRLQAGELLPDDRATDRALISNMVKTYNNLGVVLYKMGQRTGNTNSTSQAMVLWTNSTELATNAARERETFTRRDTKDLAYLNLRQILNPLPEYELQIYQPLPRDMNEPFF
ncbi:MAG: hypothetical protein LBK13_11055 [Spirochaetales bacterium]|jgi:hypothetical protein|nr:hypothetical protein [Spirochaetales bacterium]